MMQALSKIKQCDRIENKYLVISMSVNDSNSTINIIEDIQIV